MQYYADSLNLNPDKLRVHNEPKRGMGWLSKRNKSSD